MDDKRYIRSLINEGEHQQQDFKYRVSDAMKLAKSVSAFANTDGGRLLIGVRDDGHMSGVRDEEEIYMMHQAAYHQRAYIRIADENIVASPVHLAIWRESQKPQGTMMTYTDTVRKLIDTLQGQKLTLNQLVRLSKIPRHKVITLLARLIRFHVARWVYTNQQFLFNIE